MELLKLRILKDSIVHDNELLSVDSFLSHQIDIELLEALAKEFKRRFEGKRITKILTVEVAGIPIACMTARQFKVPVVYAKKDKANRWTQGMYTFRIHSFTHNADMTLMVPHDYLNEDDNVLIIDDILANGTNAEGLLEICDYAAASVEGYGCVVEKGFLTGGRMLRDLGVHVESLCVIESMSADGIKFKD
ncbi:MAG: xanthine phosphoribosyltransferase [Erysipelotrichaceae bacterium]|nr:xanthine phosphoribosyltransferase [Erysipelotrichaceae bacterium]